MSGDHLPEDRSEAGADPVSSGSPCTPSDLGLEEPPAGIESPEVHASAPPAEAAPPPEGEAVAGILDVMHRLESTLAGEIRGLRTAVERELRAEATREKVVDRLHAELQEYKQDLLLRVMRPVFLDLIQLHDDIDKVLDLHAPRPADPPGTEAEGAPRPESDSQRLARLLDVLRGLQQGVNDILARQGVDPFTCEGAAFDPRQQRALSTIPADAAERVRSIAVRHRVGFRSGDRVIRPELVTVFGPPPAEPPPP